MTDWSSASGKTWFIDGAFKSICLLHIREPTDSLASHSIPYIVLLFSNHQMLDQTLFYTIVWLKYTHMYCRPGWCKSPKLNTTLLIHCCNCLVLGITMHESKMYYSKFQYATVASTPPFLATLCFFTLFGLPRVFAFLQMKHSIAGKYIQMLVFKRVSCQTDLMKETATLPSQDLTTTTNITTMDLKP